MPTRLKNQRYITCLNETLLELKSGKKLFDGISDSDALTAAARLTETAAFNLADVLDKEDVTDLLFISHQISEFVSYLESIDYERKRSHNKMH